ncbi:MAG: asparagine synthase (glutamine-hydrolyzing) [Clostridia bacterium]|nr:asparagine synthase (glutamine-hydrolyzing) [Clostridia bacterium]
MCGFVGFTDFKHKYSEKKEILSGMMDRIIHRGPDMEGEYCDDNVALGFRRLSIIDLSEGACQPLYNEDKTVAVIFNGEIYNFQSIRSELIDLGHKFETEGDSEVLLHAYEQYGVDMLKKLRGMFAFVIYDIKKQLLFGTRDIFGIKPHYYYVTEDGELLFGSEIKAFLDFPGFKKEVNKDALRPYLTFQYSSGTDTFWKGVKKLEPATYYVFQNGELTFGRYWDEEFESEDKSFDEYVEIIDKTVNESVAAHRISDVKVGSFLSGGVDSSYITACLMPDKTFSVGFIEGEGKFNETTYAKELSDRLNIQNFKKIITPDECFDAFPTIQYHMDEPQSNPSSVPLYFLAQLAREHVTVVLSGEGADELFAGYDWYADTKEVKKFKKVVPGFLRRALATLVKPMPNFKGKSFLLRSSGRPEDYFFGQALVFSAKEATEYLAPDCRGGKSAAEVVMEVYKSVSDKDELTKKQQLDMKLWLPGDILLKADKMSMAHSLELRVPFLDKVVMEMAEKIPHEYKVNEKDTKYVFRKAANRTLPDEWADRKKQGFPVPIRFWLREEKYYNIVKEYFAADYAKEFFDVSKINSLLEDHYSGKANNGRKIWTVFTFLVWYKRFFVDEK